MIKIKVNERPNLSVCKMKCDDDLSEHLNKYEITKFFNKHQMTLIVGRPRSGKTSLLYSFFKGQKGDCKMLRGVYSSIYIFQPKNSRNSISDNIFELIPDDQKFDELSLDNLRNVYNQIAQDALDGFTSCIIYDDMGAFLKNRETLQLFKSMSMNKRHLKLSSFFLVQTWYSVNKELRRLWDNVIVFKVSKDELTNIFEEVVESNDKSLPISVSKIVFDKVHQWLFIHLESQRLFKLFDELIFQEG
jgi:GTPase SAR1 family protein